MFKFNALLAPIAVACVACGASFTANDGNGAAAGAANGGQATGGLSSSAGSSSVGEAGEAEAGGTSSAGQGSTAGEGGSVVGVGGTTSSGGWGSGRGGWGNGGWRNGTGGASATDCLALQEEYEAAVQKARVCDKGSTDQCTASSLAQPIGGCGCPVPINAKSEAGAAAKKAYQAYQSANCQTSGPLCDAFCAPPVAVSCAQQPMTSGNGFVCTAATAIQN
jgi:hypothetical protein